ncbi:MAG: L-ribulose-5-phosphate 4-epimerase AraD [Bryobacteraceae bacterium]|nr:L-ribulose-5-phosphate 4-epimerase AraD [Solibacteraceae bacterium]MCO5352039.1 L-ribulose-5-phosphate 4-epimerase AraD [Bryobacteraceae bacterium]
MLLKELREEVLEANLEIVRRGLVLYTFGNASGIDRESGQVVIKPSGVPFEKLRPEDMVVTTLEGAIVEGGLKPSSDLDTHLELYKAFAGVGGLVHTHSTYATAWAQAGHDIPCFGTTHADYFHGPVPVTDPLDHADISGDYERNVGHAIVRTFEGRKPLDRPGILVRNHGPFVWGPTVTKAAMTAVLLEEIARIAAITVGLNPEAGPVDRELLNRHFFRKHGSRASYGQG